MLSLSVWRLHPLSASLRWLVVGELGMVVMALGVSGTDVHRRVDEPWHVVQQSMVCGRRDGVRLDKAEVSGDNEAGLGADGVPDPAQPQVVDVEDAGH
jgi:hypothetical protein